jgi:hypothetical protein
MFIHALAARVLYAFSRAHARDHLAAPVNPHVPGQDILDDSIPMPVRTLQETQFSEPASAPFLLLQLFFVVRQARNVLLQLVSSLTNRMFEDILERRERIARQQSAKEE